MTRCLSILLVTSAASAGLLARAPAPVNRVLLVVSPSSAASARIAEHYIAARHIPAADVLRLEGLPPDPPDEIDRDDYGRLIEAPIARWVVTNAAQDRIDYIVLTKGVPLRIKGTPGPQATISSVDSELALLYRRLTGEPVPLPGPVPNPYFAGGPNHPSVPPPFSHETFDIFLVARLDAFSVDDVIAAIERSTHPSASGGVLLDQKASWTDTGNVWLTAAADRLRDAGLGDRVVLDRSIRVVTGAKDLIGYYSWGSNDPAARTRRLDLHFVPGAVAAMFVSTDGRTLREPPPDWDIGAWSTKRAYFGGSPQSLAGDLIRMGATGAAGHVAEPYLGNTIRPDVLFPAYVKGRTLGEAFYLAMPSVGWQTVVLGDPLCAPFAPASQTAEPPQAPLDSETLMPRWFSDRRLAVLSRSGRDPKALRYLMRAEVLGLRNDTAELQKALEKATGLDEHLVAAHLQLAAIADRQGKHEEAIARYRRILAINGDDALALNNLAYALAVHAGRPDEALPLAQKATTLVPDAPALVDTLGWIQFLRGEKVEALRLLEQAASRAPTIADIHVHLATAYADAGRTPEARAALDAAVKADPSVASRPDVLKLRDKLKP